MGDFVPIPLTGTMPLDPIGGLRSPDSLARSHHVNPLHCKILGTPAYGRFYSFIAVSLSAKLPRRPWNDSAL